MAFDPGAARWEGRTGEEFCADTLLEDIKRFAGGRAQHDDATVILIRAE